ncbi:Uncharacterised protein [Mycobacteroides abscessus subsp. abscessus]|uniref:hypothetical protein n=1 Tax=Mycobacteroides abscessus TaxID=36809 RepID=UPI00092ACC4E|nr:hypothetical protein [Mycobacteroides abscessus]SHT84297.1 Uncharacterised protein [Mycobacteroides abscessus subsp. abscessus]SKO51763.1 Uncharacterised protein [Mycobacteroides abscessus subsp. abscessus]
MNDSLTNTEDTWITGPQISTDDIPAPIQYVAIQKLTVTRTLQRRFAIRWNLEVSRGLALAEADLWWDGRWNEVWSEPGIPVTNAMDPGAEAKAVSWNAALDGITPYVADVLGLRSLL